MPKKVTSSSSEVRRLLQRYGLTAKKSLGQHFLEDQPIVETIIAAAELTSKDTVIEVGPGLGVLTSELIDRAGRVIAVELDNELSSILRQRFASETRVSIINEDILSLDPTQLLEGDTAYKVVANLPYNITSPVLRYFVEAQVKPSLMVVMIQKEVAAAIAAGPGKMTALAVHMQLFAKPEIVTIVPSSCFYPPPKVDSAVVRFEMLTEPAVLVSDIDDFLAFVRSGFSAPRKQLRNSLVRGLDTEAAMVTDLLIRAQVDAQRRAETLSLEEWATLYELYRIWRDAR